MRLCRWARTADQRDILAYVTATQATARPLVLVGLDAARMPSSVAARRPSAWAGLVAGRDSAYAREVFRLDSSFYMAQMPGARDRALARAGVAPMRAAPDSSLRFPARRVAAFDTLARWFARESQRAELGGHRRQEPQASAGRRHPVGRARCAGRSGRSGRSARSARFGGRPLSHRSRGRR